MILIIEDLDPYHLQRQGGIRITASEDSGYIQVTTGDSNDSIAMPVNPQRCERTDFGGAAPCAFRAVTSAPCWASWFRYAYWAAKEMVDVLKKDGKL